MPSRVTAQNESSRASSRLVPCVHCGKPIVIARWDRWNGFLVRCPSCNALHGKRWSIKAIALASVFLNVASFFFTMKPLRAITVIVVWCVAAFLIVPRVESAPDAVQATVIGLLILGPVLVNMVLLVRHRIRLDQQPSAVQEV
jgi:hypothetical protein